MGGCHHRTSAALVACNCVLVCVLVRVRGRVCACVRGRACVCTHAARVHDTTCCVVCLSQLCWCVPSFINTRPEEKARILAPENLALKAVGTGLVTAALILLSSSS